MLKGAVNCLSRHCKAASMLKFSLVLPSIQLAVILNDAVLRKYLEICYPIDIHFYPCVQYVPRPSLREKCIRSWNGTTYKASEWHLHGSVEARVCDELLLRYHSISRSAYLKFGLDIVWHRTFAWNAPYSWRFVTYIYRSLSGAAGIIGT